MPAANSQPRRAHSGNRRDEAARLAVLHAADDLLVEHGFGALTIEAIARRAGVAKQTIYRWWPSKVAILLDTLIEDSDEQIPVPTEQPTAESIRGYLQSFARFLTRDDAGKVLLTLIAEAQHDPETAKSFHERYLGRQRDQERDMLTRAIDAGEISPRLSPDATMDALVGPIVYCALTGSSIPPGLVDTLVEDLLRPRSSAKLVSMTVPVLYVIVCATPDAREVSRLVRLANERGWDTCVLTTPSARRFVDVEELAALTGHPVRSEYKQPDEPDVLPPADALVVAPASVNTINKWAAGICDTLALGILVEGIGLGLPIVAVPSSNRAHTSHPAFVENIARLRSWGVTVIWETDGYPVHDPVTGSNTAPIPWPAALDAIVANTESR